MTPGGSAPRRRRFRTADTLSASAMAPTTRYAGSGEVSIAYQVVGDGPIDILFSPGWISQVEHVWESPSLSRFLERFGTFSRFILFDRRGTGLSEPVATAPSLADEVGDVIAVL